MCTTGRGQLVVSPVDCLLGVVQHRQVMNRQAGGVRLRAECGLYGAQVVLGRRVVMAGDPELGVHRVRQGLGRAGLALPEGDASLLGRVEDRRRLALVDAAVDIFDQRLLQVALVHERRVAADRIDLGRDLLRAGLDLRIGDELLALRVLVGRQLLELLLTLGVVRGADDLVEELPERLTLRGVLCGQNVGHLTGGRLVRRRNVALRLRVRDALRHFLGRRLRERLAGRRGQQPLRRYAAGLRQRLSLGVLELGARCLSAPYRLAAAWAAQLVYGDQLRFARRLRLAVQEDLVAVLQARLGDGQVLRSLVRLEGRRLGRMLGVELGTYLRLGRDVLQGRLGRLGREALGRDAQARGDLVWLLEVLVLGRVVHDRLEQALRHSVAGIL